MTAASAIVATGQTNFAAKRLDVSIPEMVREAIDRCLDQRGVNRSQLGAVVVGNMELFEGVNEPEQLWASASGAGGVPIYKCNTGGTVGASVAVMCDYLVSSGLYDLVLGIGYEKQSEGDSQGNITTVGDPIWERSVMAGAIGNFAVMASQYVAKSGVTPEQAAKVAVKARRNACLNPHAHLKKADITVEEVLASRMLAAPVRLLDMCPASDGAAAVLVRQRRARPEARAAPRVGRGDRDLPRPAVHGRQPRPPGRDAQPPDGHPQGLREDRHHRPAPRPRRRRDLRARDLCRARHVREPAASARRAGAAGSWTRARRSSAASCP